MLSQIKADSFVGKKMGTAARLFLDMRKASTGDGPATPREIYDALVTGGFAFETKSEGVAMVSVRNMLRKNSQQFYRLQNGKYGLTAWYPGAKVQKVSKAEAEADSDEESETEAAEPVKASAA